MFILFRLILRNRKHLLLLISSFFALIFLTLANSLEVSAFGVLVNPELLQSMIGDSSSIAVANPNSKKHTNVLQQLFAGIQKKFFSFSSLYSFFLILIAIALFKACSSFMSRYMNQLMAIRISRDLRYQYFQHIQLLPMNFYQHHNIGGLCSRVSSDSSQIAFSVNSMLVNYFQTPLSIIATLFFCFYLSWRLSLVVFCGLPFIVVPVVILTKRVKKISRQLQLRQENFSSVLIDFLSGIQTIKTFAMEVFSIRKYKEQNDQIAILETQTAKYGLLIRPILHLFTTTFLISSILFGILVLKLTISELVIFCGLLQMSYDLIKKFADENMIIQKGIVAASRMLEVLKIQPEIQDEINAIELKGFHDRIEFDHIWFSYDGDWVLKDISLTIYKGETIAIVGPTGSGKSTLAHLIPRLYQVQRGTIRIDGKPLSAYTQSSLRENIAFVSQKPFLFTDTIRANIAFGRNFSLKEIQEAAIKAHADEFIQKQPQQYESFLLEAGQNLSGGQQQRLAIARALVKNAPILVLDEATSALDMINESRIHAATSTLKGQMTQIIIAHRLSTIEHADRIVFLDQGMKIAEGTKEELLRDCAPFKEMWKLLHKNEETHSDKACC